MDADGFRAPLQTEIILEFSERLPVGREERKGESPLRNGFRANEATVYWEFRSIVRIERGGDWKTRIFSGNS